MGGILNHSVRLVLAVAVAAFAGGCGSSSDSGNNGGGGGTPNTGTVNISLTEWGILATPATAPAGKITFHVKNDGKDEHEFVVIKTDLTPDKLPVNAEGDVDEEGAGVENVGEIPDVASAASSDLVLTLAAGKYVLICNIAAMEPDGMIEHHYPLGMRTAFTIE